LTSENTTIILIETMPNHSKEIKHLKLKRVFKDISLINNDEKRK